MRRPILLLALSAGLLGAAPARAERLITFREALETAEQANPGLARAELTVVQAEGSLRSAQGIFDPTFGLDARFNRSKQVGFFQGFPYKGTVNSWDFGGGFDGMLPTGTTWSVDAGLDYNNSQFTTEFQQGTPVDSEQNSYTTSASLSVSQPLLRGLRLGWNLHNVTQAREGLTVAELRSEQTRQETLADAAAAYWTWVYEERRAAIAVDNEEVATEALRIGTLRLESGELAPVERTRLEAALVQAESETIATRIAAAAAEDSLLLLLGASPDDDIAPATPLGDVPLLEIDLDAAVEVALAQNLDLAILREQLDGVREDLTYARHGKLPSLAATASVGVASQSETLGNSVSGLTGEDAFPYVTVGGELSVPLGNRAAGGEAARTSAVVAARELEVEELERSIESQVSQQVLRLTQARRQVELADVNLRLAEETLAAEEALERAGRSIQKDVLEARTQVQSAHVEAAKARADYRLAQTELLRLQGQVDRAL